MWTNIYFFDDKERSYDWLPRVVCHTKEEAMERGLTSPLYKKTIFIETPITNTALRVNYPNIDVHTPRVIHYK